MKTRSQIHGFLIESQIASLTKLNHDMTAFLPQEEDDFQNAEEELELDQSSELYKTIVAAIIKEEEDGDIDEEDGELEEDAFDELEEKARARDAGVEADSQASGRVIKRFVTILVRETIFECETNLPGQAVLVLGGLMMTIEQE